MPFCQYDVLLKMVSWNTCMVTVVWWGGEALYCDRQENYFIIRLTSSRSTVIFKIPFRRKLLLPSYNFLIS